MLRKNEKKRGTQQHNRDTADKVIQKQFKYDDENIFFLWSVI